MMTAECVTKINISTWDWEEKITFLSRGCLHETSDEENGMVVKMYKEKKNYKKIKITK